MLYVVGLGLGDETDISVKGLEIVKKAARVYLEAYTSVLFVDLLQKNSEENKNGNVEAEVESDEDDGFEDNLEDNFDQPLEANRQDFLDIVKERLVRR